MFSIKTFAFAAICLLVFVAEFTNAGKKSDTIILGGHGCGGPSLVMHNKKKSSTIIMGGHGDDCHHNEHHYHHHEYPHEYHYGMYYPYGYRK